MRNAVETVPVCAFKETHIVEIQVEEEIENANKDENEEYDEVVNTTNDEYTNCENEAEIVSGQCHLCRKFIGAQEELMNHFEPTVAGP